MLVGHAPIVIEPAEAGTQREETPSYALRAALALRLAAPRPSWVEAVATAQHPAPLAGNEVVRADTGPIAA